MEIETYGFIKRFKRPVKHWYEDFTGVKLFGRNFLGFSIYNNKVVVNIKTHESKPSNGVWLYICFYVIHFSFQDPWGVQHYYAKRRRRNYQD